MCIPCRPRDHSTNSASFIPPSSHNSSCVHPVSIPECSSCSPLYPCAISKPHNPCHHPLCVPLAYVIYPHPSLFAAALFLRFSQPSILLVMQERTKAV